MQLMKKYKEILEVTMSKQTAVEWFYKKLKNYKSLNLTDKLIQDLYKQALQMEKEQIQDAWDKRCSYGVVSQTWRVEKTNSEHL